MGNQAITVQTNYIFKYIVVLAHPLLQINSTEMSDFSFNPLYAGIQNGHLKNVVCSSVDNREVSISNVYGYGYVYV